MVASFGERLKREREKRGMTLEDVSGVTKISVRNLRALEQETFGQMPGGIFNRGFVRSYAKHLGLDDEQVVADYMEAAGETVPAAVVPVGSPVVNAPVTQPESPSADGQAQVPWAALVGLLVLGTLVLAFWSYHSHHKAPQTSPSATEASSSPVGGAESSLPGGSSDSLTNTATPQVPPVTASGGPVSSGPAASGFDVSLRAHDEVWLSTAVDGQPPSESTLEDGQSVVVHASNRAILRVGNAAALDVAFNGQKVPVHAAEGQVRTLTFTPSGLQVSAGPGTGPN